MEKKNNTQILFHAACLYGGTEGEGDDKFYLVGFADDEFDTNIYLMLQKAFSFDEQDKKLGMNQIYLEFKDQEHSCYGGVKRLELGEESCTIDLDAKASKTLGLPQSFTITFPKKHKKLKSVGTYLEKIFKDNKDSLVK
jgi:hypothetical protein